MTTPFSIVALPNDFALLPGVRMNFVLDAGTTGYDMRNVATARCRIEKPDHSYVDWALSIEGAAPAPTIQDVTVFHLTTATDFADKNQRPLGGTYVARFFATFSAPAGEVALGTQSFAVEQMV